MHLCPTCQSPTYQQKNGRNVCRTCNRRRKRKWKLANPERVRLSNSQSYYRHLEKNRKKSRAQYQAIRQDPVQWAACLERKRKAYAKSKSHLRREAKRLAWLKAGDVTTAQLVALYQQQNGKCFYCHVPVKGRFVTTAARGFDHIIAMANGGKHTISNMVVCCHKCNTEKGTKQWTEKKGTV